MSDRQPRTGAHDDNPSADGSRAGDRLLAHKERVLSVWTSRLRQEVAAAGRESEPILIDTLPAVLDQLAEALSPRHQRQTATQGSTVAQEHGGERVRLTHFRLEDLVAEYKILREVLFDVLEEDAPLTADERHTLSLSLDQMLMEACTGYALVQSAFRDQFFATIAHDMRTPLGVARSSAALIARDAHAARVPALAARIIEHISRVDRMVQDLLDAMRVQTGARMPLELGPCDLADLVREVVERLDLEHGERFVVEAPAPVSGQFDREALRRALENLAGNALKYAPAATAITVTVLETRGRAILTVHNHGTYIPPEKQETLFRAFQRLTEAETSGQGGWGLGLAQVRAVAEAHGGSIAVDSLPDRGTTFIVDIPTDSRSLQREPGAPAR